MYQYIAHAGHKHAAESSNTDVALLTGVAAILIIVVITLIIFDKKRAKKEKADTSE